MRAWACVVSGRGEAALALIDVFGPDARPLVEKLTGRPVLRRPSLRRLGDEVMVRYSRRGFTGEPTVTVSCHGGRAACEAVLASLRGVEVVGVREMILRAWRNGAVDRTQAEAYHHLLSARTHRAARMLQDQWEGALGRELREGRVDELQALARLGIALVRPPVVVLAGEPNAGKSTLFNALLQRERALVSEIAGTTRDPVRDWTAIDGIPVELIDTAGVEEARDEIEAQAIERALSASRRADLVVWVREPTGRAEAPAGALEVWSKRDLGEPPGPGPAVSARTGEGLDGLRASILHRLSLDVPDAPGRGMIFTPAQLESIRRDPAAFLAGVPQLE
jgi:tRNA modification GTPase